MKFSSSSFAFEGSLSRTILNHSAFMDELGYCEWTELFSFYFSYSFSTKKVSTIFIVLSSG